MSIETTKQMELLERAQKAGIDLNSPKAFVIYLLQQGEKGAVLSFYKPNSVEFDLEKFNELVAKLTKA